MEKIWYIIIDDKKEGPFTFLELKRHENITPDTLAWKEGYKNWLPLRDIKELEDIFKDEPEVIQEDVIEEKKAPISPMIHENEVITLKKDPYFNMWILFAVFLVAYVLYLYFK